MKAYDLQGRRTKSLHVFLLLSDLQSDLYQPRCSMADWLSCRPVERVPVQDSWWCCGTELLTRSC